MVQNELERHVGALAQALRTPGNVGNGGDRIQGEVLVEAQKGNVPVFEEVDEHLVGHGGVPTHGSPVPGQSRILVDVANVLTETRSEVDPIPFCWPPLENNLHRHIWILAQAVHGPRELGVGCDKVPGNVGPLARRVPVPREGQKKVALQKGRVGAQKGPVDLEFGVRQHEVYGRLGGQGGPRQFGVGEHFLPGDAWIGAQGGPVPDVRRLGQNEVEKAAGRHGVLVFNQRASQICREE